MDDDLAQEADSDERLCWNCFLPMKPGASTCEFCNADLNGALCWSCQHPIGPNWDKCHNCGAGLVRSPRHKGLQSRGRSPGSRSPRKSRTALKEEGKSEEERLKELGVQYKLGNSDDTDTIMMVTSIYKKPDSSYGRKRSSKSNVEIMEVRSPTRSPGPRSPGSIHGRYDSSLWEFVVEAESPRPISPKPIKIFKVPPLTLFKAVKKSIDAMKEYEVRPPMSAHGVKRWPKDDIRPASRPQTSALSARLPERQEPAMNFAMGGVTVRAGFQTAGPSKGVWGPFEATDTGKEIMSHQFRVLLGINDMRPSTKSVDRTNDDRGADQARRTLRSEGGLPPSGSATLHQTRMFGGHFPTRTADMLGHKFVSVGQESRTPRPGSEYGPVQYGPMFSRGVATPRYARRLKRMRSTTSADEIEVQEDNRVRGNSNERSSREDFRGKEIRRPNTSAIKPTTRQESRGQTLRNVPRTADGSAFKTLEGNFVSQADPVDPDDIRVLLRRTFTLHTHTQLDEEKSEGTSQTSPSSPQSPRSARMKLTAFFRCLGDLGKLRRRVCYET